MSLKNTRRYVDPVWLMKVCVGVTWVYIFIFVYIILFLYLQMYYIFFALIKNVNWSVDFAFTISGFTIIFILLTDVRLFCHNKNA